MDNHKTYQVETCLKEIQIYDWNLKKYEGGDLLKNEADVQNSQTNVTEENIHTVFNFLVMQHITARYWTRQSLHIG